MSLIDPFVDDLGADDLSRLPAIQSTDIQLPATQAQINSFAAFEPDSAAVNGEVFILCLAYENTIAATAKFSDRLFFPVNPEEFSWTTTRAVGTYDILNAPQATQLGNLQTRVIQLNGFFPSLYEPDFCIPYPAPRLDRTPQQAQDWLWLAERAGYPLVFTALPLRGAPRIFGNVKVVISSLGLSYRAGNPLDVYYELELTEYTEPTILRTATSTLAAPTWASTGKFAGHKYITRKGDTLISIARAAYGKNYGNLWTKIRAANKKVTYAGKKHSFRNAKGKVVQHSNESLLPAQHIVIPQPGSTPR